MFDFAGSGGFFPTPPSSHRVYHRKGTQPLQLHRGNPHFRHDSCKVTLCCVACVDGQRLACVFANPEYAVCLMLPFFVLRYLIQNQADSLLQDQHSHLCMKDIKT